MEHLEVAIEDNKGIVRVMYKWKNPIEKNSQKFNIDDLRISYIESYD